MSKEINDLNKPLKDQLELDKKQDKTDNSLATTDKTIVGAINELFQSANNGKELIANAIGEPLSSEDTFSAMSNDINGLLSTFKTNMMNNGVTVESGDKFKSLIDKIATMAEEGSGNGIQFAEGNCSGYVYLNSGKSNNIVINHNLGFIPQLFFVSMSITNTDITKCDVIVSNLKEVRINTADTRYNVSVNITNISEDTCTLNVARDVIMGVATTFTASKWFAIGVGEDDTTLLDSLKSILAEEGVATTDEDDMASLIAKVDSEFNRQVVPQGNASANQVLQGSTFMNSSGQLQTGTIPYLQSNIPNVNVHTANHYMTSEVSVGDYSGLGGNCVYFAMPTGVYNSVYWLMSYVPNLRPENIASGVNILGVLGTATTAINPNLSFSVAHYDTSQTIYHNLGRIPNAIIIRVSDYYLDDYWIDPVLLDSRIHKYLDVVTTTIYRYGGTISGASSVRMQITNITTTSFVLNTSGYASGYPSNISYKIDLMVLL